MNLKTIKRILVTLGITAGSSLPRPDLRPQQ